MAIKRYVATADNTITNAFKQDLQTRGTGSNMGASDVLEVFSIYGHATSASVEKARALVNFPISTVKTDRSAGTIPESGSVKFFLRMFNTPHGQTLPKNFDMQVLPISKSWSEGQGLDMEEYSDEGVSNWVKASTTKLAHTTDIKVRTAIKTNLEGKYFVLHNGDNVKYNFWFDNSSKATASFTIANVGNMGAADTIVFDSTAGTTYTMTVTAHGGATTNSNTTSPTFAIVNGSAANTAANLTTALNGLTEFEATRVAGVVTVTQSVGGTQGNVSTALTDAGPDGISVTNFTGGTSQGGPNPQGTEVAVPLTSSAITTVNHIARQIKRSIHNADIKISASISVEDTEDSTGATVRSVNNSTAGVSGSFTGSITNDYLTVATVQSGGQSRWVNAGGDFHEVGYTPGKNLPHYVKNFSIGTENLDVNITALVEEWLAAEDTVDTDRENYGVMLKMSGSFEDGTRGRSYYTKKFFSRTSEFFYKRPAIEARWDDSILDDRANFFRSSSLASGEDNLNTLYLYNFVRGQLRNIPVLGGASGSNDAHTSIHLQVFPSGNIKNNVIKPISLPIGGGVTTNNSTVVSGGWVSTGIYSASFAFTGSSKEIFEVWSKPTGVLQGIQLVTGSVFTVKKIESLNYMPNTRYATSIKNLKPSYSQSDKVRFRVFIREKDWSPNIYTKATQTIEPYIVEKAYYRIFRIKDDFDVITYGSGSGNPYTKLSYDINGNYFDLDMSLLEENYAYGLKLSLEVDGRNVEQEEIFKFRVE